MILSVSRRTDIPAFYSDWFFNRIKNGFVYVRNPMNIHNISKINIRPEIVDCIVFWTKDPSRMLERLSELKDYEYYFQFTLNAYAQDLEKSVPRKNSIIDTFKKLADTIGENRVMWRYDPILLSEQVTKEYHEKYFEELAKRLSSYTKKCTISFIDNYKKTEKNLIGTKARELVHKEILSISSILAQIGESYNIEIQTCAEEINLQNIGIKHGRCIDNAVIEDLIGSPLLVKKDKNQRKECGCVESIDIGEYNSCPHNCLYCYANFNKEQVINKWRRHDPLSPLLVGDVMDDDKIRDRTVKSLKSNHKLF